MDNNKIILNRRLNLTLLIHIIGTLLMYLGYFLANKYLNLMTGLVGGVASFVIVLIIYFIFRKHKKVVLFLGLVGAVVTGIIIGTYFSQYHNYTSLYHYIILYLIILILMINLLLRLIKYRRFLILLINLVLLGFVIYGFVNFKVLMFQEFTFCMVYLFSINIGLLVYLFSGDKFEDCIACSFFIAFIVIFIIILIIISDGDAVGGFDIGLGGGEVRQKRQVQYH